MGPSSNWVWKQISARSIILGYRQWRSQGPGPSRVGQSPTRSAKKKDENLENLRKNKNNRLKFEGKWGKWNSCPPRTACEAGYAPGYRSHLTHLHDLRHFGCCTAVSCSICRVALSILCSYSIYAIGHYISQENVLIWPMYFLFFNSLSRTQETVAMTEPWFQVVESKLQRIKIRSLLGRQFLAELLGTFILVVCEICFDHFKESNCVLLLT